MQNISHEDEKAVKIKFRSERRYPVSGRRTQKNFLTDPDYQPAAAGSDFQRRPALRDEGPGPGRCPGPRHPAGNREMCRPAEKREAYRPVPPHLRTRFYPEFDEKDREIFMRVFGDEDSADAAVQVIRNAPPEIAVLTLQIMEMIRRAEGC